MGALTRLSRSAPFAGWVYLLLALATAVVAGPLAARGVALPQAGLAAAVALSCLTHSLPLVFVAGSVEFRYLAWPVLSALLSPLVLFSTAIQGGPSLAAPPLPEVAAMPIRS